MKSILCRAAAPAALLLVGASLSAEPAATAERQDDHGEHAHHAQHTENGESMQHADHAGHDEGNAASHVEAAPEAQDAERVCRHVKLDMSSRRKTKVCKTADEWREFNQRR